VANVDFDKLEFDNTCDRRDGVAITLFFKAACIQEQRANVALNGNRTVLRVSAP
jgi:hypothetical protein